VTKTTTNGFGLNNTQGVVVNGNNIYAATTGGLAISTDNGNTWVNKTIANGLIHNMVYGVAVSGSNIYAATFKGLSKK
jgi:hypothetical protein